MKVFSKKMDKILHKKQKKQSRCFVKDGERITEKQGKERASVSLKRGIRYCTEKK